MQKSQIYWFGPMHRCTGDAQVVQPESISILPLVRALGSAPRQEVHLAIAKRVATRSAQRRTRRMIPRHALLVQRALQKSQFPGFRTAISGLRYYNTSTGRWLSRDPIGERGGLNVYGMVSNNPIGKVDKLGRSEWKVLKREINLNGPGISVYASATASPHGFEVQYTPSAESKAKCKVGRILLYQVISRTGLDGALAHVDRDGSRPYESDTCKLPPEMRPKGSTEYSYVDSPGDPSLPKFMIRTFRITAVAVCRCNCNDTRLSSYYFEFSNHSRDLDQDESKTGNEDHLNNGLERFE